MSENPTGMTYPVTCPWCAVEGRYTVVRYSTIEGSTGICPACLKEWRAEAGLPPIEEDSNVEIQKTD